MSDRKDGSSSGEATTSIATPSLSTSQQDMVREQLDRILASSLFRNSKRFPDFLRYTVRRALNEDTDGIKERTIGIDVFGREPHYDTSLDPVVRVTAAEVRKRLAHYYQELGHEHELRIDFARGSYIPEFRFASEEFAPKRVPSAVEVHGVREASRKQWRWIALATTSLLVLGFFLLGATRPSALDRFWGPVVSSNSPVLLCIPALNFPSPPTQSSQSSGTPARALAPSQVSRIFLDRVSFGDSMALSTLTGVLGSKGKPFRVRHSQDATLADLQEGPVVLIGAFSNRWTMQLEKGLRYNFAQDGQIHYIADRRNPSSHAWASPIPSTAGTAFKDYSLISRVRDATTGRVLITVAGIHHFGTEVAAECLASSTCVDAAQKLAPGDWKQANIQVVLETTVIGQNAGRPKVLAAYLW